MPELPTLTDERILSMRGPRNTLDPWRPYAILLEPERSREGMVEDVATIFLTNKECPFRCLMCDLWKNTTPGRIPRGAAAAQVRWGLERLGPARHVKLYNSGNFFDNQAISAADRAQIAEIVRDHRTVIVESHPRLVGRTALEFAERLGGRLEVAMGLETVDPEVLPRLNKRMSLEHYERAARFLVQGDISVRAFILLRAPFQDERAGVHWAGRSIEWAFSVGVECCVIIPTRPGNGIMEWLAEEDHFSPPSLDSLEEVLAHGLRLGGGRVFADLWDLERSCAGMPDLHARVRRLRDMNLTQRIAPERIEAEGGMR